MPAALLLAQTTLYIWMAPRGFEFTDESYYLLNYLYWRDLTATVTFFGAYFEWPFRILGQSVSGIRIFSLVALVVASGFFVRDVLRFSRHGDDADASLLLPFAIVGVSASCFYFGYFASGRAPSYNLQALCAMLIATGLLLRLTRSDAPLGRFCATAFGYGLALAACGLAKAPAGALTLALHSGFFAVANCDWRPRHLLELSSLVLAGVALNLALLQLADPGWVSALREGVAMTNSVGHGDLLKLGGDAIQEVRAMAPASLGLSVFALVIVVLARNIRHNRRAQISIAVVGVVCACALELARSQDRRMWLPIVVLTALVLWSFETPWRRPSNWTRVDAVDIATMGLLFMLPVAFSYGTNLLISEHSQMAAVFGIAALLIRLQRLADRRLITRLSLGASLALLCVPTLTIQLQNTFDEHHAYRLRTALIGQTEPARIGAANTRLLLDTTTRDLFVALEAARDSAGFTLRRPVLDLTGDGPGLIYALGGRPLGVAWLSGGYSGSEVTAAWLIAHLPRSALQHAWLLTSRTNPRRITGWQRMIEERLGVGSHEWVATVGMRSPYIWHANAPERADFDLWRPRVELRGPDPGHLQPDRARAGGRATLAPNGRADGAVRKSASVTRRQPH